MSVKVAAYYVLKKHNKAPMFFHEKISKCDSEEPRQFL